jgi:hypothetical protein
MRRSGDRIGSGAAPYLPESKSASSPPKELRPMKTVTVVGNASTGSGFSQKIADAAPRAEQRLLSALRRLDGRGECDRREVAHAHRNQGPADHQQVLVRRRVSVQGLAFLRGNAARRFGHRKIADLVPELDVAERVKKRSSLSGSTDKPCDRANWLSNLPIPVGYRSPWFENAGGLLWFFCAASSSPNPPRPEVSRAIT